MADDDERHEIAGELSIDADLSGVMREPSSHCAHFARIAVVLNAEIKVRYAISASSEAISPVGTARSLGKYRFGRPPIRRGGFCSAVDQEIELARKAESEALILLPPDALHSYTRFPGTSKRRDREAPSAQQRCRPSISWSASCRRSGGSPTLRVAAARYDARPLLWL